MAAAPRPGGPTFEGQPFIRRQARLTYARDGAALLFFAGSTAGVLWRLRTGSDFAGLQTTGPLAFLLLLLCFFTACLLWVLLFPASWRRWRMLPVIAVRLTPLPGVVVCTPLFFGSLGSPDYTRGSGVLPTLYFVFTLLWSSGTLLQFEACVGTHLPPVLSAATQLASTAAFVSTNRACCSAAYMAHPVTQARMTAAYVWLEPLIAPLEPLLWAAEVTAHHPRRKCHCVLLALQVWGGLIAPLLLVCAFEARAYRQYRLHRLQRLLLHERRQERAEHRHWTRAVAANRRQQADQAGLSLSDISSTTSNSDPDSPEAAAEAETARTQAAALMDAPAPPGLLLLGDWQYELAHRALVVCRQLAGWRALPAAAVLCLMYAWHVLAYPWK